MHDAAGSLQPLETTPDAPRPLGERLEKADVVSTHVLVEHDKVEKLKELSRRTRVAQSEYLREAVDDLLTKYAKLTEGDER